jgi:hypothetical protein
VDNIIREILAEATRHHLHLAWRFPEARAMIIITLSILFYADDGTVFAPSAEALQRLLKIVDRVLRR